MLRTIFRNSASGSVKIGLSASPGKFKCTDTHTEKETENVTKMKPESETKTETKMERQPETDTMPVMETEMETETEA